MWPFSNPDDVFRDAVKLHFGSLARDCSAKLVQVEPLIWGFCTQYAVLTVGAYPGHFRGICVKLRRREKEEKEEVSVKDSVDIGLANVEELVTGHRSDVHTKRQRWAASEIEEEIAGLAAITRTTAMPFLTTSTGDWDGLRSFVDEKIRSAPKPWLGLNLRMPNNSSSQRP